MSQQVKLKISKRVIEALEILAKRRKCTLEKALSDAVSTELDMDNKLQEGYIILAQEPDPNNEGACYRIIFTHMSDADQM